MFNMLAHIQSPGLFEQITQTVSWGMEGICAAFFAFLWYTSLKHRNFIRGWGNAGTLSAVFALAALDKIVDIIAIWHPIAPLSIVLEFSISCVFLSWLMHNISEKTLPIFLSHKEITDIDRQHHEKLYHQKRITKMLSSKNEDSNED